MRYSESADHDSGSKIPRAIGPKTIPAKVASRASAVKFQPVLPAGDGRYSQMKSFSLIKYETSPMTTTYPPATARASEVLLISRATMAS